MEGKGMCKTRGKAVMYGAGNIGRGFIGQQFSEAGYEVIFIDVNEQIINGMNDKGGYPIKIVSQDVVQDVWVDHVSAVDGRDEVLVAKIIAEADIMATAVGVNVLPYIIKNIAVGLKLRWRERNLNPLNILLCENLMSADEYFIKELSLFMDEDEAALLLEQVGFIRTSIGRMVPVMTEERRTENPLGIWVEPYCQLPVDVAVWKGQMPDMKNLVPYTPFDYYVDKKLFIHNMGHALTAYLGQLSGYTYVWEAINDQVIKKLALKAMGESAQALARKYDQSLDSLLDHVEDLLYRFANPHLGDTIARVGKEPIRKLGAKDRLIGAANCCLEQGIKPETIACGIAAALLFEDKKDEAFNNLKKRIESEGIKKIATEITGTDENSWLVNEVDRNYRNLLNGSSLVDVIM